MMIFAFLLLLNTAQAGNFSCQPIVVPGSVELKKCETLKLVLLSGTPEERARAGGGLFRVNQLSRDMLDYFSGKLTSSIAQNSPTLAKAADWIYGLWAHFLHRKLDQGFKNELAAMSEASGISVNYFERAAALPDTAVLLFGLSKADWVKRLPFLGCTSGALASPDGSFVIGRNLDFLGTSLWDRLPTVTVHLPPAGSKELKHVAFGADGSHFGGITGINEAGITFAVHQGYTRYSSFSGVPMMYIGEAVLRQATSLEEAEAILKSLRPNPLWYFIVGDLKRKQIMTVEDSVAYFSVRKMEGTSFANSNHMIRPTAEEVLPTGVAYNSRLRYEKVLEILNQGSDAKLSGAEKMAHALSYQSNPEGELSIHNDILKAHTIQTVIFDIDTAGEISIYTTFEAAPTASGRYLKFKLNDLWSLGDKTYDIVDPSMTPPEKRQNQIRYATAFARYFDEHDLPGAYSLLKNQKSAGAQLFLATNLYQQGRFADSYSLIKAANLSSAFANEPKHIKQSLLWVEMLDLIKMSKSPEAKQRAEELTRETIENPKLEALAKRLITNKDPSGSQLKISYDFFGGDLSSF